MSAHINRKLKLKKKAEKVLAKKKEKAKKCVLVIYDLLENGEVIEARQTFMKNSGPLRKYAGDDIFNMLEMTIDGAYEEMSSRKSNPKPSQSQTISTATVSSSKSDVSAYEAVDQAAEKAQDSTMALIMKIYSLLESNPVQANNLFSSNYGLLKTNSKPEVFTVLETTVKSAR